MAEQYGMLKHLGLDEPALQADPSGVWLITPLEVRDEDYFVRRKGEEERRANWTKWMTWKGMRG